MKKKVKNVPSPRTREKEHDDDIKVLRKQIDDSKKLLLDQKNEKK